MSRLQAVYFWVTVKCDKLTKREERKAKPGYLVKMAEINPEIGAVKRIRDFVQTPTVHCIYNALSSVSIQLF